MVKAVENLICSTLELTHQKDKSVAWSYVILIPHFWKIADIAKKS